MTQKQELNSLLYICQSKTHLEQGKEDICLELLSAPCYLVLEFTAGKHSGK